MKVRKKPVVVEAVQYLAVNKKEIIEFVGEKVLITFGYEHLIIPTLEGDHKANVGDWIIKGINGEFYPCKPDIFNKTYEIIEGK